MQSAEDIIGLLSTKNEFNSLYEVINNALNNKWAMIQKEYWCLI
jgi:hypothetical protein